jgi:hypothetical protein
MNPILGFVGNLVGGVLKLVGINNEASAAEKLAQIKARSQEQQTKNLLDAYIVKWNDWLKAQEALYSAEKNINYWQQDTQRTRIYYNFESVRAVQGALLLTAGVGLLGLAVWRMSNE